MEALKMDVAMEANKRRDEHKRAAGLIINIFREMNFTYADAVFTLRAVNETVTETAQRAKI